jgi:hypothetical protein
VSGRGGGIAAPQQAVIPRESESGVSSTPRPFGSIADVSGIPGRPVKPGDDSRIRISDSEDRRDIGSRSRRMFSREVCSLDRLPLKRGRRECRALDAPAASYAKKSIRVSHHGHTGTTRHSPRNGLRFAPRSPRRSGFFVTVALPRLPFARLDASVEASGPHGFTVRAKCPRQKHFSRPPHPAPRS